jgi:SAM-dependent methyltransferase
MACLAYPDEIALAELYKSMPPNMEEAIDENDQLSNQHGYASQIIDALRQNHQSCLDQIRLLELGADRGLLAKALCESVGHKLRKTVAIEPNQEVWTSLKAALQESSRESQAYCSMEEMLSAKPNTLEKFDIIAAVHVLDHTYDPVKTLNELKPQLSEHGIIYIVVHNPNSTVARLLGSRWPAFCAQHPQLFTPLSICQIAKNLGFKVIRQGRTRNNFSLALLTEFLGIKIPRASQVKLRAPLGNRFYCLQRLSAQ